MMLPVRDLIRALLLGLCLWQSAAAQDLGRVPYAASLEMQAALAELAASVHTHPHVACHFESSESLVVGDNATATHLYRIAQEAISNAIRHARARRLSIAARVEMRATW